ncbi:hypothetical protein VSAK1_26075 [Vibrio mediterranei AK1]|nr:hypothetical protein VSAK1_26075 [Vibrio mediterranei AK1]
MNKLLEEYEFVPLESIPPKLSPVLIVEVDGKELVPMFQFGADNKVYKPLKKALPELKSCRSDWDICFWLTTKLSSVIEAAVPSEQKIYACKCADDIINLGLMTEEQSTFVVSTPLELLELGEDKVFNIFYEYLLDL